MTFLQRYRAGAHAAVWEELASIGPDIRNSSVGPDAMQVAVETMTIVRKNLEVLRGRLEAFDYRFGYYPDGTKLGYYCGPLAAPTSDLLRQVDDLTTKVGAIPLSLETFWRIVGAVDFIGQREGWPEGADPIVVLPPEASIEDYAGWRECVEMDNPEEADPFLAPIAPDILHKDNISGGSPYALVLPNGAADALVVDEWHNLPFVSYLREAILGWGGFPGLSKLDGAVPSELLSLPNNLLRF